MLKPYNRGIFIHEYRVLIVSMEIEFNKTGYHMEIQSFVKEISKLVIQADSLAYIPLWSIDIIRFS